MPRFPFSLFLQQLCIFLAEGIEKNTKALKLWTKVYSGLDLGLDLAPIFIVQKQTHVLQTFGKFDTRKKIKIDYLKWSREVTGMLCVCNKYVLDVGAT